MINNDTFEKIKIHIGDRIKYLRQKNEEKQDFLSKELGISRTTLSDYETGKRMPTLENLIIIARHFQVGCDDLIGTNGIIYNDYNNQYDIIDVSGLSYRDVLLIQSLINTMETHS